MSALLHCSVTGCLTKYAPYSPPQCEEYQMIRKEQALQKKMEARAVNICQSGPSLEYAEDLEEDKTPL